jgi:hypothetical protein
MSLSQMPCSPENGANHTSQRIRLLGGRADEARVCRVSPVSPSHRHTRDRLTVMALDSLKEPRTMRKAN